MSAVRVVWAREVIPGGVPTIFLAGPTPRRSGVKSWRPEMIQAIEDGWHDDDLVVLTPELNGPWDGDGDAQFEWETMARSRADVILFWLWRDLDTLPGFTTNVEFGLDAPTGKVVLGAPPDCPNPERNNYLVRIAKLLGVPVCTTLEGTADLAVAMLQDRR